MVGVAKPAIVSIEFVAYIWCNYSSSDAGSTSPDPYDIAVDISLSSRTFHMRGHLESSPENLL